MCASTFLMGANLPKNAPGKDTMQSRFLYIYRDKMEYLGWALFSKKVPNPEGLDWVKFH